MRVVSRGALITGIVVAAAAGIAAADDTSKSEQAAGELVTLLDAQKLDAIAAPVPDKPGRFVAALYYPDSQLLVVSADYPAPAQLQQRIDAAQFKDAYLDLYGAGARKGRVGITDLRADGLHRERGFDVVYRDGKKFMAYDGNWKAQHVDEDEYNTRFGTDDEQYSAMLQALAGRLKQGGTTPAS